MTRNRNPNRAHRNGNRWALSFAKSRSDLVTSIETERSATARANTPLTNCTPRSRNINASNRATVTQHRNYNGPQGHKTPQNTATAGNKTSETHPADRKNAARGPRNRAPHATKTHPATAKTAQTRKKRTPAPPAHRQQQPQRPPNARPREARTPRAAPATPASGHVAPKRME